MVLPWNLVDKIAYGFNTAVTYALGAPNGLGQRLGFENNKVDNFFIFFFFLAFLSCVKLSSLPPLHLHR